MEMCEFQLKELNADPSERDDKIPVVPICYPERVGGEKEGHVSWMCLVSCYCLIQKRTSQDEQEMKWEYSNHAIHFLGHPNAENHDRIWQERYRDQSSA